MGRKVDMVVDNRSLVNQHRLATASVKDPSGRRGPLSIRGITRPRHGPMDLDDRESSWGGLTGSDPLLYTQGYRLTRR